MFSLFKTYINLYSFSHAYPNHLAYVIEKEAAVLSKPFEDSEVIEVLEKYDNVVLTGTNDMAYHEVTLPDGTVGYIDNECFSTDIQAVGEMKAAESTFLLQANIVDPEYHGTSWEVEDRELLERIITREYGADYNGSVLVCQVIRDIMVYEDCHTMGALVYKYGFNGSIYKEPTQIAKDAISFVFDEGGSAVQHRIMAYYASNMMYSGWHETQKLIIQYQDNISLSILMLRLIYVSLFQVLFLQRSLLFFYY